VFLWRISNHLSLAGDGALRTSGRWHTRGRRIVYCAQSPAAALLEILVHFEIDIQDLPVRYRLLKIEAPDEVQVERVSIDDLPKDWPERTEATRALGDGWLTKGSAALFSVPSAIVPETFSVLLNPAHQDARRLVTVQTGDHAIDPRLLK
jgi:RES domain-containing protein